MSDQFHDVGGIADTFLHRILFVGVGHTVSVYRILSNGQGLAAPGARAPLEHILNWSGHVIIGRFIITVVIGFFLLPGKFAKIDYFS